MDGSVQNKFLANMRQVMKYLFIANVLFEGKDGEYYDCKTQKILIKNSKDAQKSSIKLYAKKSKQAVPVFAGNLNQKQVDTFLMDAKLDNSVFRIHFEFKGTTMSVCFDQQITVMPTIS